jgi:hypothetical protein
MAMVMVDVFNALPLAAIMNDLIYMSGGQNPDL